MVSADEPLAAGVVDALLAQGTRAVGPTARGPRSRNKAFARSLLAGGRARGAASRAGAHTPDEVADAFAAFGSTLVVVKPSGLTGGKGVK